MGCPRLPRERVRVFWRARLTGQSIEHAAAAAGVSVRQGHRWVVESGGMIPEDVAGPSPRYLSLAEREEIALGWQAGLAKAEIARRLGRHRSTIGRELVRNQTLRHPVREPRPDGQRHRPGPRPGTRRGLDRPGHERLRYRAWTAQAKAEARIAARARGSQQCKLAANPALCAQVQDGLSRRWSPEQISATLRRRYPDRPEMWVSYETIYQELYVQGRGRLRRELTAALRTGRAVRRPRRLPDRRRTRIPNMVLISARPAEAADRAVPGHWEGDLIIGAQGGSAIGTLVERTTRFVMLLHLPDQHDARSVRDAMIPVMVALPAAVRRSLTWDQGVELARHAQISMATDMPIFFCDPHSPWQRGTNENTNGLLRQYFPKGTDLSVHTAEHLAAVAAELNARPRKTLDWDTPAQALTRLLSRPITTGVASTP